MRLVRWLAFDEQINFMGYKNQYDYNIVMIDTENSAEVLRVLLNYGREGYRFVGWTPNPMKTDKIPHLKEAIFEFENRMECE